MKADIIVVGGGGILSNFFFPIRGSVLKIMKWSNIPIVLFSPGIAINSGAEIMDQIVLGQIKELYEMAAVKSVRDIRSLRMLEEMGIRDCVLSGDPALFLPSLENNQCHRKKRVGLNIAYHGWKSQELFIDTIVKTYIEIGKYYISNGYELVYLVHHDYEYEIANRLKKELDLDIVMDGPRELLKVYGTLEMCFSMMLHSAIFAYCAEVPVVLIKYDVKHEAFMEMMGGGEFCVELGEVDGGRLIEIGKLVQENSAAIRSNMQIAKSNIKAGNDLLVKLLEKRFTN
jgi:polysaccharide pyruvyl transferase WcaK-like protein